MEHNKYLTHYSHYDTAYHKHAKNYSPYAYRHNHSYSSHHKRVYSPTNCVPFVVYLYIIFSIIITNT